MAFFIWLAVMSTIFIVLLIANRSNNTTSRRKEDTTPKDTIIPSPKATDKTIPTVQKYSQMGQPIRNLIHKRLPSRFDTPEAYHLRQIINDEIESIRTEKGRNTLDLNRLYFEFEHDRKNNTYELTISMSPQTEYGYISTLDVRRIIKLPEVIYKPMFMLLQQPLRLDEFPTMELGRTDAYPHTLTALLSYLPTDTEMKEWSRNSEYVNYSSSNSTLLVNDFTANQKAAIAALILIICTFTREHLGSFDENYGYDQVKRENYANELVKILGINEADLIPIANRKMELHFAEIKNLSNRQRDWFALTIYEAMVIGGRPTKAEVVTGTAVLESVGISFEKHQEIISRLWDIDNISGHFTWKS